MNVTGRVTMPEADGYLDRALFKEIIVDHVLADIRWAIDSKHELAAAQLLFSAIDAVAGLERPADQEETTADRFIEWANAYLQLEGPFYALNGLDLWGCRCGFLHGYTSRARVVRQGDAKMLTYVDQAEPPVLTEQEPKIVIVSLKHLLEAFARGVADTMTRINRSEALAILVNPRLAMMFRSRQLPPEFAG